MKNFEENPSENRSRFLRWFCMVRENTREFKQASTETAFNKLG